MAQLQSVVVESCECGVRDACMSGECFARSSGYRLTGYPMMHLQALKTL